MFQDLEKILNDKEKLDGIILNAFCKIDKDLNGSIELDEVKEMLLQLSDEMLIEEPTEDELNELRLFLDPDGDGKMTFKEFHALFKQMLMFMIREDGGKGTRR